jgi:hypothetical protein
MKDFNISLSVNNLTSSLIAKTFKIESHGLVIATRMLLGLNKTKDKLPLLKEVEQLIRLEINELERLMQPDFDSRQQPVTGHYRLESASAYPLGELLSRNPSDALNERESAEYAYCHAMPELTGPTGQNIKSGSLQTC